MQTRASHQPILFRCALQFPGPMLEIGCGDYSTPHLHEICAFQHRYLLSLDSNKAWVDRFADLRTPQHEILFITDWNNCPHLITGKPWGLVFVDHAPAKRRKVDILALSNIAQVLVVHDTESKEYDYHEVFPLFKHRFDYKRLGPHTTVLSNFIDVASVLE
jgi:hypothetical protein